MSRKCRPLCNLSSTTSSRSSTSCVPLHSAVLIDTEKGRRKWLIWLPAPVTCQLSSFFSLPVSCPSLLCPIPFFSLLRFCFCLFPQALALCLCLSCSSTPSHSPLSACVVFSRPLRSLSGYLHLPVISPPFLSLVLLSSSAVTSKVLYVCLVNYVMKISTKQYRLGLGNKTMRVHAKTGTRCTNVKR